MPDILITPPIRTPLISSNGDTTAGTTPDTSSVTRTTRDWWLYWDRLGNQANSNARLVTQGTHAGRPDAAGMPEGAIYVESDRGSIYQVQNGVWRYVAGTMWGTITPDQRPTDLGANDGGFHFRGTDDAREFLWSGTQWIETTEVRYGTHAGRPNPLDVANGALYVEFDRGSVIYQNQNNVWKYLAGTMYGTLAPDQRPADLGVNDGGFDFRGTDQQRQFLWSQTVWVEVASLLGDVQYARATTDLILTTTPQAVPGATMVLNRAGQYLLTGNFYFAWITDGGNLLHGRLVANGVEQPNEAFFFVQLDYSQGGASQQWLYRATTAGQTVFLRGFKDGGTGSSRIFGQTSLTALWISP